MNRLVIWILGSPLHPLLSGKVQLVRYEGRRSGRIVTTPTQYVELDRGAIGIVVAKPDTKRWWRNFTEPRPIDLRIRGTWRSMVGTARWRHDDPATVDDLRRRFEAKYGPRGLPRSDEDLLVVLCRTGAAAST